MSTQEPQFKVGDKVRIKDTAFEGTNSPNLQRLRGTIVTLTRPSDASEGWWIAESTDKYFNRGLHIMESEIEAVKP